MRNLMVVLGLLLAAPAMAQEALTADCVDFALDQAGGVPATLPLPIGCPHPEDVWCIEPVAMPTPDELLAVGDSTWVGEGSAAISEYDANTSARCPENGEAETSHLPTAAPCAPGLSSMATEGSC